MPPRKSKLYLACEAEAEFTEAAIRDYGKRYWANTVAEEIINHIHFWREERERSSRKGKKDHGGSK